MHRRVRRTGDSLLPWVAPLAVLVLTLGWAPAARAAGTIRVAVVEGARTVEVGGGPMVVSDAVGRPGTSIVKVSKPVGAGSVVAVTVEPSGGSPQPTSKPFVLSGAVS